MQASLKVLARPSEPTENILCLPMACGCEFLTTTQEYKEYLITLLPLNPTWTSSFKIPCSLNGRELKLHLHLPPHWFHLPLSDAKVPSFSCREMGHTGYLWDAQQYPEILPFQVHPGHRVLCRESSAPGWTSLPGIALGGFARGVHHLSLPEASPTLCFPPLLRDSQLYTSKGFQERL